jgi:hypothetical protein
MGIKALDVKVSTGLIQPSIRQIQCPCEHGTLLLHEKEAINLAVKEILNFQEGFWSSQFKGNCVINNYKGLKASKSDLSALRHGTYPVQTPCRSL